MRSLLVSSIGVAAAAALAVPLSLTLSDASGRSPAVPHAGARGAAAEPGATRSLPLVPLGADRRAAGGGAPHQGLPRRDVEPFSLLGVVWEDARAELPGTVQVRTRAAGTGAWSPWREDRKRGG